MARPKSNKSKFHVALELDVMDKLKKLSAAHGVPVGDIVWALLQVSEIGENPAILKHKIGVKRDAVALYVPSDPVEAEKVLLQALLQRRASKKFEQLDGERDNSEK